ncbi:tetratricopeptide repeat protein [Pseudonocardia yunnanensis]|uniref:Tetratricopeptide repeat protein n=1 Tax=Pseudonocardia yunnanensis TaxID=58107 RepID=A0ABW4FBA4_9PSEU
MVVDGTGFEVLADHERMGPRRVLEPADVDLLEGLAGRYLRAVQTRSDAAVFVGLGRELYRWLDGEHGQLSSVLERATSPLVFEIVGQGSPTDRAWAVLRAPFELLARLDGGFLAADGLMRFSVVRRLGTATEQPVPDQFRLGLAFMASSPRGQHELDFEAEEAAILKAVGESRVDLVVDDTGDPEQLGHRLADLGGMPVVHLSCHGVNNWQARTGAPGVPVLMMEDDVGEGRPTTAADLVSLLAVGPRLLFVSACLTATGADATGHLPPGGERKGEAGPAAGGGRPVAHSFVTALVTAGVPAVIAWDGSVGDRAATLFAEQLYRSLADRARLSVAVGDARRVLLESDNPQLREDWHLARLWLGPRGGGPLVAGSRKRSLVSATHGTKTFLGRKRQVPVAAAQMFVGRRPEMQDALRALRSGERSGALLHGQGRLGKSSLAARIADRCPDRAVAVVFGDYSALAILDAVAEAVRTNPAARDLIAQRLPEVRARPEAIESVLIDLLAGPCAQTGDGQRPLLLIIDDLEQILVADAAGPHQVASDHAPVLAAVLRAFDPAETDSRLLLTSRFTFALNGLEAQLQPVQLRPLSTVAQRKLQRRQQALTPSQQQVERAGLAARALSVSRGNPGLQDLIGLRLVYGEQVPLRRAEAAVAGMETYLHQGDLPSDAEVRVFLENLALDTLLQEAGPADRALLRATTLFDLPVPQSVIETLAELVGGSPDRLRGFGLLDPYQDQYDPARSALAANPLTAGRVDPLSTREQAALAAVTVASLFAAWGGTAPRPRRDYELDLQLTRVALLGDNALVVAACAVGAIRELRVGPAADALRFGHDVIELLDRHNQDAPLSLLRAVADAAFTSGDGSAGEALLDRAMREAVAGEQELGNPLDQARVIVERARRLITRGETQQAEQLFRRTHQVFMTAGSEREAAAVMGDLTDMAFRRGDYDEALRIYREVQLPVYERLGDSLGTAITWGRIAEIAFQRGDCDEALRIYREVQLPVYECLGDTRSTAATWGRIAEIAFQRGDYDEALRIYREVELPVYERLGDSLGTATTWGRIADIAFQRGDYDEALRVRREVQLPVYERLGDTRSTATTWGQIADIAFQRGDYDEALRVRREVELPVYERLGDIRSTAATWGQIADIAFRRGDYDEALRVRREVGLPVYEHLGDTRSTATTWGQIADIAFQRGDYDEALRVRREVELPVYEHLGDTRSTATTWGQIADIAFRRGDYDEALRVRREVELPVYERLGDIRSTALTWGRIADIAFRRGDYDEALRICREVQLPVYERLGDIRSTALTWGQIADIAFQRGDYDEALRVRREVELPVYERLGDIRSTALTWGQIADIAYQRGDYDEAAELRQKRLEVTKQLGDLDGIGAATWDLARIDLARDDYESARPRLVESFQTMRQLGRSDGIAVVGFSLGKLLASIGQADQARDLLGLSLAAASKIGDFELMIHINELLLALPGGGTKER